ncbi:hypothetical protein ACLOAV_004363 [Pseudogymnoascus australis]
MIVPDEANAPPKRPLLDAREQPPQFIKDIFKRFQRLPLAEISTDSHILDFTKGILPKGARLDREISSEDLQSIYHRFVGDGKDFDVPDSQPVYSCEALPGLLILPSFLPSRVQRELLSRLLHRDLSDSEHMTNVHMFYDMPYPKGASTPEGPSETPSFFSYSPKSKTIFNPKDPSVHKPLTISKFMEKSLRWVTLGGQYDWTNKVYPDEAPPAFPTDIKDLLEGIFPEMKAQAAIVNLYSPGDTLSLHRDVSEESDNGLVSISLGCDCLFVVGLGRDPSDSIVVHLRSGDALLMSRESRFAWHGVPKILPSSCPTYLASWPAEGDQYEEWRDWMKNKRINLNVNCLHEIFFKAAIADAQRLDDYYAKHNAPIGPLHGLPISLKDQFHVRGVETTMGYVGWINTFEGVKGTGKERVFESEMVRELRALGAVLYVKTAVPHTLMHGETVNNVIGYCWNPKNRRLVCGGSSGGEGALIACRGASIGLGTDIGGSIRVPSAFNGLYGIRPSVGRLPYEGMANAMQGQNSILSVVGPMGTSVGGLRLVMKAILSQKPWLYDPAVHEIPWRSEQEEAVLQLIKSSGKGRQLAFGVYRHDGVVRPLPPVRRALDITVKTIEKLGHKVIDWAPPSHAYASEIALKTWIFDGGLDVHTHMGLAGEPLDPAISTIYGSEPVREFQASEIAKVNVQIREYRKQYSDYWNSTAALTGTGEVVDAFIMPVTPFPAATPMDYPHYGKSFRPWLYKENKMADKLLDYCTVVNLLDYPSIAIPVTISSATLDPVDEKFVSLSGNPLDKKTFDVYDPEVFDGAFVGLQLVGRRLHEERLLALAEMLGDGIEGPK